MTAKRFTVTDDQLLTYYDRLRELTSRVHRADRTSSLDLEQVNVSIQAMMESRFEDVVSAVIALPEVGEKFHLAVDGVRRGFKLFRVGYCCSSLLTLNQVDPSDPNLSFNKVLERLKWLEPDHKVPEPGVLEVFRKAYPSSDGLGPVSIPNDDSMQHAVPRFGMVPVTPCGREDDG